MIGKVVRVQALRELGWDQRQIQAALDAGTLTRVARGWVAGIGAHPWAVTAVRAHGRLGCLSGCKLHGLWTPSHSEPHVVVAGGARLQRSDWHRHYGPLPQEAVFSVQDCLAQVIQHHDGEDALIVLESAVQQQLISRTEAELLIAGASGRKQHQLRFFDPSAESGSETRLRIWLQQQRVSVRPQVHIPGVGRVDFLVGNSLLIECDSREFHPHSDEDYRRDMAARALGYTPIRITYRQLFYEWEQTKVYLLRMLQTRQHTKEPRPH